MIIGNTSSAHASSSVREAIADPSTGHDPESRLRNAWRICRLARLAERQGLLVVVSTMLISIPVFFDFVYAVSK